MTKVAARIAGTAAIVLMFSGMGAAAASAQPSVGGGAANVVSVACANGLATAVCVAP